MAYVDGFVIPIPKDKVKDYQKIAKKACKIWMEHGAIAYHETIGDDMEVKDMVSFPKLAKAKENETVVFAWIVYKSKSDRNKVNAKVMKDPRIMEMGSAQSMPFDCKRMAYGGFKSIVSA